MLQDVSWDFLKTRGSFKEGNTVSSKVREQKDRVEEDKESKLDHFEDFSLVEPECENES